MGDDIAIKVNGVHKDFKLPHQKVNSIKSIFTSIYKKRTTTFEVQHALKDISFEVKKGEFFGIVGRNGSGKSTLLKIIAEIYRPTKGHLQKSGKLVPFIELGVGFNPELTGRENVYLNGALLGFSEKEIDEQYEDIVEFAELEPFMDQKLKNYSSGMQVRLAFSVATRAKADILLIDEVLAVGDADFQRKCFDYFRQLKRDKKTVIFVSHDMGAIREYCDQVLLIDNNEVIAVGDAEEIAKKYTQLFVPTASGQKADPAAKRWGNTRASFSDVSVKLANEDKSVVIEARVHAKEAIDDPIYGFMVSNDKGQPILGTNSSIIRAVPKPLGANTDIVISWEFPNIFNDGKLSIELVLMYNSITEVADWWEDAATFTISNESRTPYIINPPTLFSSKEIK